MHIGWQVGVYPAKSETWVRLEIEQARAQGHEVTVSAVSGPHKGASLAHCDFVVCHFATMAGFANAHGRPFLLVPHAADLWPTGGTYLKWAVGHCRHMVAVGYISEYHKERYLEWGTPASLLTAWPCAVDVDLFRRQGQQLGGLVVAGGRNVAKKGLPLALQAWPDVVLFGDHPQAVGWLHPAALRDLLQRAWCYLGCFGVGPNGDMDGLPIAVLEALAMGLRVVTTRVAGLADLEGLVTYTLPEPARIRQAIEQEPHIYNEKGPAYVRAQHAPERVLGRLLGLITERGK